RLADHREELALDEWVEAARRLVEHEQVGPVHERLDEPDLLAVALRERVDGAAQVETEPLGERLDRAGGHGSAELGEVSQERTALDPAVEAQLPWDVPDAPAQARAARARVLTEHGRRARARPDDVEQEPQRGRLARTVGPD